MARNIDSMETFDSKDNSYTKHVLHEGSGDADSKANEGSICQVEIHEVDNRVIESEHLGLYKLGSKCEVTIGEGDTMLTEMIDSMICSMRVGEKCYIKMKRDVNGKKLSEVEEHQALKFRIVLHSVERAATSSDLEQDEKLDRAQHHKECGSQLYPAGNVTFAAKRFKKSLRYLRDMEIDGKDAPLPSSLKLQKDVLTCQCHLNLAACYLKTEKWNGAVKHSSKALMLEPNNVKGLFRRGQAYVKLQNMNLAKEDFLKAKDLDRDNKAVLAQLRNIETIVRNEKEMCQKMLSL